uniref:Uncharacterized protein n=1 Tax=Anguilla anguilla TaxID=7936 RepID=A0A0E9SF32_ANGAN
MRKFSESKAQCLFPLLTQYRTCALQFKEGTACPPLPQCCRQTMWTAHFCGLCHKLLSLLLHPHKKRF